MIWLPPLTLAVLITISSFAGYFIYRALTFQSDEEIPPQHKEGIPSVEENLAALYRPVICSVEIAGVPEGADVYVDGTLHPERPIILLGENSPFTFRVEAEGHVTWKKPVAVHSNLTLTVPLITYEEAAAALAEAEARKGRKKSSSTSTHTGPAEVEFDGTEGPETKEAMKKRKKGKFKTFTTPPKMEHLEKLL